MTPEQFARARSLFEDAMALPAEARVDFVARACADDAEVQREVEGLLAVPSQAAALDQVRAAVDEALAGRFAEPEADERTREMSARERGVEVGNFRLLDKLGEGGMGEVWAARQEGPIRRRVAIKLIKRGMDTAELLRRFDAERQALAMMDHPNIARVFDAGETPDGRPFFAMEYVAGVPLTEYCDAERLSTRERLELFLAVCDGVQHAHQKAILHRDLKPSNVLVTVHEGRPVPKIIDFGVAKALGQPLTERTLFTELGQLVGTPEYMSPEQADLTGLDVDTRTDVYSLGVMLYELLVGERPFDGKRLREAGFDGLRRIIREDEPPRPSARLQTPGEASTRSAHNRRTGVRELVGQVRGDLDWITMKALEKERRRRYGSASELAADLRRYLHDEPVSARPPSTTYRMRKFARRHRLQVASAAMLLVVLVAFAAASWLQARRVARERDRANLEAAAAARERDRANLEAAAATEVSQFLVDLFDVAKPGQSLGATITARELLDRGAQQVSVELADQPVTQGRLMATIGEVYSQLGLYDEAARLLGEGLALQRRHVGPDDAQTLRTLSNLARLTTGRGAYDEAVVLYTELVAARERAGEADRLALAEALNDFAAAQMERGSFADAAPLLRRAREAFEAVHGPEHEDVATVLTNLGVIEARLGDPAAAEASFRRSLAIREAVLAADHPDVGFSLNNLAFVLQAQGRPDEALPLYQRALAIRVKTLGPDHPQVATVLHNLAGVLDEQGESAEAERLARQSLAIREAALGPEHRDVAFSLSRLARIHQKRGEHAVAVPLYQRSIAILEKSLGPETLPVASALSGLAESEAALGRRREALDLYARAERICRALLAKQPELVDARYRLAAIQLGAGDVHAAAGSVEEARQAWRESRDSSAPGTAQGATLRDLQEIHATANRRLGAA